MQRLERLLRRRSSGSRRDGFSSESVGPTFGKTVARSAAIAIIASLLLIMAYVAFRFEPKFAIPVMIALFHDLLITAGVYSLTGREVTTSTVAALLTILGFSLYDTVIVFDRIRENAPRMPRAAFSQIVNRSMSEVLTRSLATSFCTLIPVASLLIFGGETLKDFAFALLVGIASGAYSSIFIAAPVLTEWKEREPAYRAAPPAHRARSSATCPPSRTTARRARSASRAASARARKARPRAAASAGARPPSPRRAGRTTSRCSRTRAVDGRRRDGDGAARADEEPAPGRRPAHGARPASASALRAERAERKKQRARASAARRKHGRRRTA